MTKHSRIHRSGFTLLEVIIAIGILAVTLMVLVETQASAVMATTEGRRISTGTFLADEKMQEVVLTLEREGWTSQDVEEDGNFEEFGNEEFRGESANIDADAADFRWAYTVRRIELSLPSDIMGGAQSMADGGYWGDQGQQADLSSMGLSLSDIPGFSPDMLTNYLSDYIREVRVRVWWGENEDGLDQVELVHHVINPSGVVTQPDVQR